MGLLRKDDDQPEPDADDSAEEEELEPDPDEEESEEESEDDASADLAEAIATRVSESTASQIDQRINSLMKTLRTDYGLQKKKKDEDDDGKGAPATRSVGLGRVLRTAVRDAVTDEFDDPKERKTALQFAKQIADARGLADDEDEDEIAEEIVESVKSFLSNARDHYESALRKDLEQRGLLEPEPSAQPQKKGGKQQPGKSPAELFKQGQDKAKARFGQEKE